MPNSSLPKSATPSRAMSNVTSETYEAQLLQMLKNPLRHASHRGAGEGEETNCSVASSCAMNGE
jgi:hypothetical protein